MSNPRYYRHPNGDIFAVINYNKYKPWQDVYSFVDGFSTAHSSYLAECKKLKSTNKQLQLLKMQLSDER